jgi:hypothetical protein
MRYWRTSADARAGIAAMVCLCCGTGRSLIRAENQRRTLDDEATGRTQNTFFSGFSSQGTRATVSGPYQHMLRLLW